MPGRLLPQDLIRGIRPIHFGRATLIATAFAGLAGTACAGRRVPPESAWADTGVARALAVMSFNVR